MCIKIVSAFFSLIKPFAYRRYSSPVANGHFLLENLFLSRCAFQYFTGEQERLSKAMPIDQKSIIWRDSATDACRTCQLSRAEPAPKLVSVSKGDNSTRSLIASPDMTAGSAFADVGRCPSANNGWLLEADIGQTPIVQVRLCRLPALSSPFIIP